MEKMQYTKELLSDLIARFYRHREEGVKILLNDDLLV